jgi:hypothetical protein
MADRDDDTEQAESTSDSDADSAAFDPSEFDLSGGELETKLAEANPDRAELEQAVQTEKQTRNRSGAVDLLYGELQAKEAELDAGEELTDSGLRADYDPRTESAFVTGVVPSTSAVPQIKVGLEPDTEPGYYGGLFFDDARERKNVSRTRRVDTAIVNGRLRYLGKAESTETVRAEPYVEGEQSGS